METITQTKICNKCKIAKELPEFFKRPQAEDGLETQCKVCKKAYAQSYYKKNKEKILKHNREYRDVNKESMIAKQKEYAKLNKKVIATYRKKYAMLNKEARAEKSKEYRKQNKKAIAEQNKKYKKSERGILSTKNSDNKRRMMKLAKADGTIPQKMTFPLTKELQELLHIQEYKCNNCRCDITNNHHLDHHIPLSKGGTHSISNVVFLCPTCNLTKSATMPTTLMLVI